MPSLASQSCLYRLRPELRRSRSEQVPSSISYVRSRSQLSVSTLDRRQCKLDRRRSVKVRLIDDSVADFPSSIEESPDFSTELPQPSSSEGEESDDDSYVYPYMDVDLPASKKERLQVPDAALAVAAHSLRGNQHSRKNRRIREGMMLSLWLVTFIGLFLLWFDWCSWRIVRLPLKPLFLTQPFITSTMISAFSGFLYTPFLETLKIHQIIKKKRPNMQSSYKVVPTMGGLFFIPIGLIVGVILVGKTSQPVIGSIIATLAFGVIGLFDDVLRGVGRHVGLPGWLKLTMQVAVGLYFCHWLDSANGIDGLATGIAALAFFGMSGAVLALSPELAVFGSSMAGGCIGFLFHNRWKASVVMGQTGSMALGAALAAMASCSGMFLPLFIATGLFVIELYSTIFKVAQRTFWFMRNFSHMRPIQRRLKLLGYKDTVIVGGAYILSCFLVLLAGYVGLISS